MARARQGNFFRESSKKEEAAGPLFGSGAK